MKNIDELAKKIAAYKDKWIKVTVKGYNFISYFKVLNCKFNKSSFVNDGPDSYLVDNVCITYSKEITLYKSGEHKKYGRISFSNKKNRYITGNYDNMSVSFLKEYPKDVINKQVKKLEKDLNILKSIQ